MMNTPIEVEFYLEQHPCNLNWVLKIRFSDDCWSTSVKSWKFKPSNTEVREAKELTIKAFKIYHSKLRIPEFKVKLL